MHSQNITVPPHNGAMPAMYYSNAATDADVCLADALSILCSSRSGTA